MTIGVETGTLEGKEIVDVPGFTKGNPLHQAFAEKYAKHFCDVCIVLLNNSESVEIGKYQGLEALARCFADRLDSTIFIINKCDESSEKDIEYIIKVFQGYFKGEKPKVLRISAKTVLSKEGPQFDYTELTSHLSFLTGRKILVLVRALIGRLITNFNSLKELGQLTAKELDELHRNISGLLNLDMAAYRERLYKSISKDEILPDDIPSLAVNKFDLPNPLGVTPNEYARQVVVSLKSQMNVLDEFVQENQASIFRAFDTRFTSEIDAFDEAIHTRINSFEKKFNLQPSFIEVPKVIGKIQVKNFDPAGIEKLKPMAFRLWLEKIFPGILVRDVKFWLSPISISVGPFSTKIGIPIGVKKLNEMIKEIQQNIPDEALREINDYLYDSLDRFVYELLQDYSLSIDKFVVNWEIILNELNWLNLLHH